MNDFVGEGDNQFGAPNGEAAPAPSIDGLANTIATRISGVLGTLNEARTAVDTTIAAQRRAEEDAAQAQKNYSKAVEEALADPYVTAQLLEEFGYSIPKAKPSRARGGRRSGGTRKSKPAQQSPAAANTPL